MGDHIRTRVLGLPPPLPLFYLMSLIFGGGPLSSAQCRDGVSQTSRCACPSVRA